MEHRPAHLLINATGSAFDPEGKAGGGAFSASRRDLDDPAYIRPLNIDPARLTSR